MVRLNLEPAQMKIKKSIKVRLVNGQLTISGVDEKLQDQQYVFKSAEINGDTS